MTIIRIHCPTCESVGEIEVSEDQVKNVSRGLLAINIARKIVCDHTFITYVDKNLAVRDYFVADFEVTLPEIASIRKVQSDTIPTKEIVDVDLIKLNLPAITLTYILKSIFSKLKTVLISSQDFLYNHIVNFLKYINADAFELNFLIMSPEDYKKNKKEYKDFVVFENVTVLQNPKKILNLKKIAVEKHIVNRFMMEHELGYSYIYLRNEVFKAFELAKSIINFKEKNKEANTFKITKHLEKQFGVKIDLSYLDFLVDIVDNYFGVKIPSASESFLKII